MQWCIVFFSHGEACKDYFCGVYVSFIDLVLPLHNGRIKCTKSGTPTTCRELIVYEKTGIRKRKRHNTSDT